MDYKKEFKAARAANDWNKVNELWKQLCAEAEIEETSAGEGGRAAEIANRRDKERAGEMQGGIKI